jgi:xanthine/uracil/vitamin C permease (AzgA family)
MRQAVVLSVGVVIASVILACSARYEYITLANVVLRGDRWGMTSMCVAFVPLQEVHQIEDPKLKAAGIYFC